MATADAGLGCERLAALSREIEMSFITLHFLLETRKIQLLDRVRKIKELYQKRRGIDKSIEQMEVIRKDTITENLIAGNKEKAVSLWTNKIKDMRREYKILISINIRYLCQYTSRVYLHYSPHWT